METRSSVYYGKQLLDVGQKKIVINYHTLTWTRYSFRFSVGKVIRRGLICEKLQKRRKSFSKYHIDWESVVYKVFFESFEIFMVGDG